MLSIICSELQNLGTSIAAKSFKMALSKAMTFLSMDFRNTLEVWLQALTCFPLQFPDLPLALLHLPKACSEIKATELFLLAFKNTGQFFDTLYLWSNITEAKIINSPQLKAT